MKSLIVFKKDGSTFSLTFSNEEDCSKFFGIFMTTCDRKEIAKITIINTEI